MSSYVRGQNKMKISLNKKGLFEMSLKFKEAIFRPFNLSYEANLFQMCLDKI